MQCHDALFVDILDPFNFQGSLVNWRESVQVYTTTLHSQLLALWKLDANWSADRCDFDDLAFPTGLYSSIRCTGNPAGDNFGSAIRREMRILPWDPCRKARQHPTSIVIWKQHV